MLRQLRSFLLPIGVVLVIPFLFVGTLSPFHVLYVSLLPIVQIPLGVALFGIGLTMLTVTIGQFMRTGKGTLAPWDPTKRLVVQGPYRYTRNPMISGVASMILGEAIFLASWALVAWFAAVVLINTIYFKLSEEPGLVKRFGKEYNEYRSNVPMWIPRITPWDPIGHKATGVGDEQTKS